MCHVNAKQTDLPTTESVAQPIVIAVLVYMLPDQSLAPSLSRTLLELKSIYALTCMPEWACRRFAACNSDHEALPAVRDNDVFTHWPFKGAWL